MCSLGNRLLKDIDISQCNKTIDGYLYNIYCSNETRVCDDYYSANNVSIVRGIKGLSSGVFFGKYKNGFNRRFLRQYLVNLLCITETILKHFY